MNPEKAIDSPISEDLDDISLDPGLVDFGSSVSTHERHFLDYEIEDDSASQVKIMPEAVLYKSAGETVKLDKKYETDGEISDYELAASGVTKKLLTSQSHVNEQQTGARRKKHFLDENPIPPDYMLGKEAKKYSSGLCKKQELCENVPAERKHSIDRNFCVCRLKEKSGSDNSALFDNYLLRYIGTWPTERLSGNSPNYASLPPETISKLGPKVECVYSLLSMLGSHDSVEMSKKFLELSRCTETCLTLRRSGCIPLLVQMMHSENDENVQKRAGLALHNIVHCHPDEKVCRREVKVLRLIEQIIDYCNFLKTLLANGGEAIADDSDRHPLAAVSSLMKISFDEEHRYAMCHLGALQAIANLVYLDHAVHGLKPNDHCCNSLRRYALMALTNLTFGDGNNKALLCANKDFMEALVAQLDFAPDDLLQVTASVLRNLSWRADNNMKATLNEIGTVTALAKAAMKNKNENTLKAILSALWNLSAHCSTNKAEFCAVDGALAFLVDMLTYEGPSKTLKIIENAGGILRNVSSHIAVREDYRKILRQRNCLAILLQQLKSESLTVVSNACGTLWNLSARFPEDQKFLWDNGAVPMLRSLIHSKHKMISEGSSAALKNLLNFRPGSLNQNSLDPIAKSMGLKELPTLTARKQKAFEQELNNNFPETCDNLDTITPSKEKVEFSVNQEDKQEGSSSTRMTRSAIVSKSGSRDSLISAKSDSGYEKFREHSAPLTYEIEVKGSGKPLALFNLRNTFVTPTTGFDVETETELPIDYSVKYNNEGGSLKKTENKKSCTKTDSRNYSVYQETDLDQLTNFSLRYSENPLESDLDGKVSEGTGNEIILIMEDTVKCYQTEDTPYVISNAGSDFDVRNPKTEESAIQRKKIPQKHEVSNIFCSGLYTPEKPINYCEEGTPGYFSRYESLSSLDEASQNVCNALRTKSKAIEEEKECLSTLSENLLPSQQLSTPKAKKEKPTISQGSAACKGGQSSKVSSVINSAQETPLMFSRRSSMDSLDGSEQITTDDKSSVVSDFSRLASGVISPSELPDSPTQSMPQSPRRNSTVQTGFSNNAPLQMSTLKTVAQARLQSVFEDDVNTFQVENTPAQFSCATSLSNLSLDDEPKLRTETSRKEIGLLESDQLSKNPLMLSNKIDKSIETCVLSEGEETTNDDVILATCINIGMNRSGSISKTLEPLPKRNAEGSANIPKDITTVEDSLKQYYTEDTPAMLSKVGSNTDLSPLSFTNKTDVAGEYDESSNTSDGGTELLEQCIRVGMRKHSSSALKAKVLHSKREKPSKVINPPEPQKDAIEMLRCGGLPPYLPVRDEMNKFIVEDSPCNFSISSELSNLTIGSELAELANMKRMARKARTANKVLLPEGNSERKQVTDDSLSSISAESEDDTNLLSQVIAAGCNKQKSNIRKIMQSISSTTKDTDNLMNTSLFNDANDSVSSVDSTDSNENQSRSLLEQCIRTGMSKQSNTESTLNRQPICTSLKKLPLKLECERQADQEREDEQLLRECITTGIAKNVSSGSNSTQSVPPKHRSLESVDLRQRLVTGGNTTQNRIPKNELTTPVAVLDQQPQLEIYTSQSAPNIAPGVEIPDSTEGTNNELRKHQAQPRHLHIESASSTAGSETFNTLNKYPNVNLGNNNIKMINSFVNLESLNVDFLEKENNETENSGKMIPDKHKDPNLMIKSVERLTQELVSTAEFLRTNMKKSAEMKLGDCENTASEKEAKVNSNSNNTWSEDTYPNDVSFPNISISAPIVASLIEDETTISDLCTDTPHQELIAATPANEVNIFPNNPIDGVMLNESYTIAQNQSGTSVHSNCVEAETIPVNKSLNNSERKEISNEVHFQVGGEVQQRFNDNTNEINSRPEFYASPSSLIKSVNVASETNRTAQEVNKNIAESMMNLDNIQPPSCMDFLSISSCFDSLESVQFPRICNKSFAVGLVAKRALGNDQFYGGLSCSSESVNSSCNLDNIKPPSVMDELLDSMISVESITSEIVDNSFVEELSGIPEISTSNVLPVPLISKDTEISSDLTLIESIPKKEENKNDRTVINEDTRILTPKQKRRLIKDRFKTYTISSGCTIQEQLSVENQHDISNFTEQGQNEKIHIKPENVQGWLSHSRKTEEQDADIIREQCSDDFKTFTKLPVEEQPKFSLSELNIHREYLISDEDDCGEVLSNRTVIKSVTPSSVPRSTSISSFISSKLNEDETRTTIESDYNSMECDQNSESEFDDKKISQPNEKKIHQTVITNPGDRDSGTDVNCSEDGQVPSETIKVARGKKKTCSEAFYKRSAMMTNRESKIALFKQRTSSEVFRSNLPGKNASPNIKKGKNAKYTLKNSTINAGTQGVLNRTLLSTQTNSNRNNIKKYELSIVKVNLNSEEKFTNKKTGTKINSKKVKNETVLGSRNLERQGTFIKEEASQSELPNVTSVPLNTSKTPKLPKKSNVRTKTPIAHNSSEKPPTGSEIRTLIRSNSNQSLKSKVNCAKETNFRELGRSRTTGFVKPTNVPQKPQRSNSNSSLRSPTSLIAMKTHFSSTTPPSRSKSSLSSNRPIIESRIASIWKKKNDVKNCSTSVKGPSCNIPSAVSSKYTKS